MNATPPDPVVALAEQRAAARATRDFAESDRLREQIAEVIDDHEDDPAPDEKGDLSPVERQMVRNLRKPLIIMTPKSLLRNKDATSPLSEFTKGGFQTVIPDSGGLKAEKVRRVVACSGKVYYDLAKKREEKAIDDMAILRVEQLYPFPHKAFAAELKKYDSQLHAKPRWLVFNKIDMVPAGEREARMADYVRRLRWKGPVFAISALAREGLTPLVERIYQHVSAHQRVEPLPDPRFTDTSPQE